MKSAPVSASPPVSLSPRLVYSPRTPGSLSPRLNLSPRSRSESLSPYKKSPRQRGLSEWQAKVQAVSKQLPQGLRVCILGGTKFQDPATEALVTAVARRLAGTLAGEAVVLTGGMPGVQAAFARGFGVSRTVANLLPEGEASGYGVGRDVRCGVTLEERMDMFGHLGQVYLTFEGGPGVAKEARVAFDRGALVLPMISTGGASGGMFDFPAGAMERPAHATDAQWACLTEKQLPERAADAVIDILLGSIRLSSDAVAVVGYAVEGAGGVGAKVNGHYRRVDTHNGVGLYQMVHGEPIIYFDDFWKIGPRDDTSGWIYAMHFARGPVPPTGHWTTYGYRDGDATPAPTVTIEAAACPGVPQEILPVVKRVTSRSTGFLPASTPRQKSQCTLEAMQSRVLNSPRKYQIRDCRAGMDFGEASPKGSPRVISPRTPRPVPALKLQAPLPDARHAAPFASSGRSRSGDEPRGRPAGGAA